MLPHTALAVCMALMCVQLRAQTTIIGRTLTTSEGFPDNNIRCIAQDEDGFMWFGSMYALYRYDGYTYSKYVPTERGDTRLLSARHIEDIRQWRDGLLWIRQHGNFYTAYDCRKGKFVDYTGCGLYGLSFSHATMNADGSITLEDENNGTATVAYSGGKFTYRRNPAGKGAPRRSSRGTLADNKGNHIRFTANGDVVYTDAKTGKTFTLNVYPKLLIQSNLSPRVKVVSQDNGLVWISTYGNGLHLYDKRTGQHTHITKDDSRKLIGSNFIIALAEDRNGNIWLSQERQGVACLKATQSNFRVINLNADGQRDRSNETRMLKRLPGIGIVASNNAGSLFAIEGMQPRQLRQTDTIRYISAATGPAGEMWIGTKNDGLMVGAKAYRHTPGNPASPAANRIDCVLRDRKGRMWLSSLEGCVDLAVPTAGGGMAFRHVIGPDKKLDARKMALDNKGNIVVASNDRVVCFNPDSILTAPGRIAETWLKSGAKDNAVLCLLCDGRGNTWVGTDGNGIYRLSRGRVAERITVADGLASDVVKAITADAAGNIWAATIDGCSMIRPDGTIDNMHFGTDHLLNTFNEDCAASLADGRVMLGSMAGIVVAGPAAAATAEPGQPMPMALTQVLVNGSPLTGLPPAAFGRDGGPELRLDHDQNTITLRFSDFSYGMGSQQSRYSFFLEGYDSRWSEWSPMNIASYRDLPTGRYTLMVKASGSGTAIRLPVVVAPPLWATPWAIALYIIAAAAVAFTAFSHLRTVYRLRRDIAMEKRLTDFKIKFFTDISHEFRTPLTLIRGNVDAMRQSADFPKALKQSADSLKRNTDRMMRLINQLLEFRRMEEDKLQPSLEETDIVAFLRAIADSFHDAAANRGLSLGFMPQARQCMVYIDRGFVDKIVYELLQNAMKYTPRGGSITLRTGTDGKQLNISVEDTGIGVPDDKRREIFERYVHGRHDRASLGIGLNFVAALAKAHHGSIECRPNPGGGTVFTLSVPATADAYSPTDFMDRGTATATDDDTMQPGFRPTDSAVAGMPMNSLRVLIVDDDDEMCMFLRQELGKYFITDVASDGQDAMDKINDRRPDLVISDVMMPRVDGFGLTRWLRANTATAATPIILLTALDGEDKRYQGLQTGADAYIAKPFSMRLLVMQCRNLLMRVAAAAAAADDNRDGAARLPEVITDEADSRLLKAIGVYIDSHLADPGLSVDKIADAMNYGRSKFYDKVKHLTGKTPNDIIREKRLQRAAELLRDGSITVAEVAYQVGMSSPQYLSVCFKRRFGMSPTQYQGGGSNTGNGGR